MLLLLMTAVILLVLLAMGFAAICAAMRSSQNTEALRRSKAKKSGHSPDDESVTQ